MNSSNSYTLVQVRFTVFDVGAIVSEGWLGEFDNSLVYLPPACDSIDDCITLHETRKISVLNPDTGWRTEYENDYRFTKWAVVFEFSYAGEGTNLYSVETPIEREIQSLGEDYLFEESLGDILDEADDLIFAAAATKDHLYEPIYAVSFVTLWEVEYYRCSWEYDEWDVNWWMVGRVSLNQLAHQLKAVQGLSS